MAPDNGGVSSDEAAGADPVDAPSPGRRTIGILAGVAVVVFAVDVVTKTIAVAQLSGRPPVRILGGTVYLELLRNPGAAFSLATGMTWVLALIAVAVCVAIVWLAPKLRSVGWAVGLGLVLAGALGNLVDRLFRAPGPLEGHVVDFVSLFAPHGQVWPVFNAADSAITCGGVLIVILTFMGRDYDGTRSKGRPASASAPPSEESKPSDSSDEGADRS